MLAMPGGELRFQHRDLAPDLLQLRRVDPQCRAGQRRQPVILRIRDDREQFRHAGPVLRGDQTELRALSPQRVAELGALLDQEPTGAMERQHGLILGRLDLRKPHGRPLRCLADRRRVSRVVLVGLQVRLDELRRDQLHGVSHRPEHTAPVMPAAAGLDRHAAGRQGLEEGRALIPSQAAVQELLPRGVGAVDLHETLAEIEPDGVEGRTLQHGMLRRSRSRAR